MKDEAPPTPGLHYRLCSCCATATPGLLVPLAFPVKASWVHDVPRCSLHMDFTQTKSKDAKKGPIICTCATVHIWWHCLPRLHASLVNFAYRGVNE